MIHLRQLQRLYFFLAICIAGLLSSCSKADHTVPFFKTFRGTAGNAIFTLRLVRNACDSTTSSYYGYISREGSGLAPHATQGFSDSLNAPGFTLHYKEHDTTMALVLHLNKPETEIEGWIRREINVGSKVIKDSIPFSASEITTGITYRYHSVTRTVKLFPDSTKSPVFSYRISVPEPENFGKDTSVYRLLRKNLFAICGTTDTVKNPVTALAARYVAEAADLCKGMDFSDLPSDLEDGGLERYIRILYSDQHFTSFDYEKIDYGGAHGTCENTFVVLDHRNGRQVHLQDVLNTNGFDRISGLINLQLRKQLGLQPGESLVKANYFIASVAYTKNFYLTDQGIGFHYNPYEIAPFVTGNTQVLVPYADLEGCLKPGFGNATKTISITP
jgi:hypothetical protein